MSPPSDKNESSGGSAAAAADAGGAPDGPPSTPAGDGDECAGIPSPPRRRPPLAVFGVLLALYLIFHQRADIVYALSSSAPRAVGIAPALFAEGAAPLLGGIPLGR